MAKLLKDKSLDKSLRKILGKNADGEARFEKTKQAFEQDKNQKSLDFKKHQKFSDQRIFKIRLLGANDGVRIYLSHLGDDEYLAFKILPHDDLDK